VVLPSPAELAVVVVDDDATLEVDVDPGPDEDAHPATNTEKTEAETTSRAGLVIANGLRPDERMILDSPFSFVARMNLVNRRWAVSTTTSSSTS